MENNLIKENIIFKENIKKRKKKTFFNKVEIFLERYDLIKNRISENYKNGNVGKMLFNSFSFIFSSIFFFIISILSFILGILGFGIKLLYFVMVIFNKENFKKILKFLWNFIIISYLIWTIFLHWWGFQYYELKTEYDYVFDKIEINKYLEVLEKETKEANLYKEIIETNLE